MKKYKTAIGYLRVSTIEQGKSGTSIESQKERIKDFCREMKSFYSAFIIDTFSGKDFKRSEFEKARKFLKDIKGEVDLFLTMKSKRALYGNIQDDLEKYINFGLCLLKNLDYYYENAPVETKVKLIGSYFTEKLIFDKNKFRTLPFNKTILLICRYK